MGAGDGNSYDVAISFLNADLRLAEELADLLRDRMNVFLFTERQGEIAGSDGLEKLSAVFGQEARLAVVLYRASWGSTPWTRVEETAIKNRGLDQGLDFLLMIPLDDTPTVPKWVPKSHIWLSYTHYGLAAAVPVLERKLEELGGQAKPVTAESRARQLARHAEWRAERDRLRRSPEGADTANAHVANLFGELERAASISAGGLAFKKSRPNAARVWTSDPDRQGTTVTLYWSLSWANTLDQSGLRVRLHRGYASAEGEEVWASEKPRELERHDLDFEYDESRRWVWQDRTTRRTYDTGQLAAFCIALILDHVRGQVA